MRILLQNIKTLKFISEEPQPPGDQRWTDLEVDARSFENGLDAIYHCYRRGIADMQIVAAFVDSQLNFTVPITDSRSS